TASAAHPRAGRNPMLPMNFVFQAEDGIRDRNVTGVQTCALPIWGGTVYHRGDEEQAKLLEAPATLRIIHARGVAWRTSNAPGPRSEERRVGKECRSGRTREQLKEISGRKSVARSITMRAYRGRCR